jgi:hypothetical protein
VHIEESIVAQFALVPLWKVIAVLTTRTGPHPEPEGFIRFSLLFVLKITFNIIPLPKPSSAKISRTVLEIHKIFCHFLWLFLRV